MKYALLIYVNEKSMADMGPQEATAFSAAFDRYTHMLAEAGVLRGGEALTPTAAAVTLRHTGDGDGQVLRTAGPYAEAAEHIGGYYVIEAPDLDAAIAYARQMPVETVEIRPVDDM
ncbi:transcription initiation protein [Streptosporangiaceae bacterium NEAU-GS5]|nr:transcription initiation protein [Streptosporangiaceae bacterium NEAU-GS5]